jgi:putative ABC transport system substrate-binding protein
VKRRAFLLCGLCLAIGLSAQAQGADDLPRVAILSPDPSTAADRTSGYPLVRFLEALRERGYVDGRNIRLDFRFAENRLDRLPALGAELVKAQPAVIYTGHFPVGDRSYRAGPQRESWDFPPLF